MTAKEMFEKLGYEVIINDDCGLEYRLISDGTYINFDKGFKNVCKYQWRYNKEDYIAIDIDLQELQAINKQVEELGWK